MEKAHLESICAPWVGNESLECDGMTLVLFTALWRDGIAARPMTGEIVLGKEAVRPHSWLEFRGWIIDFRARRSFPVSSVQNGIFRARETAVRYCGVATVLRPLLEEVFTRLTTTLAAPAAPLGETGTPDAQSPPELGGPGTEGKA